MTALPLRWLPNVVITTFVLDSRELNLTLGNAVIDAFPDIKAQMKGPDVNLKVEIRSEAAYISHEEIKGAGGLPVGTAGKGMLMLSGGIDSPVAGYLALKTWCGYRGCSLCKPTLYKSRCT